MSISRRHIVVGVTGSGENTSALRWAAEESATTHREVTLVHAVDSAMLPRPSTGTAREELLTVADAVMDEVVQEYAAISGGQSCDTVLRLGQPAQVLTDVSRDAEVVVLSHRHLSSVRRIVTSSTAISVAAQTRCPVVAVPSDWSGDDQSADVTRWVTVGLHDDGGPLTVLEAGFEEAATRGAGLRLLHAWRTDPQYDDIIVSRIDPGWAAAVERDILDAAHPLAEKYPDVVVDVRVRHEWPADALAVQSLSSTLLVLGRHHHSRFTPHGVGSMARTALRTSRCPVMVVPS